MNEENKTNTSDAGDVRLPTQRSGGTRTIQPLSLLSSDSTEQASVNVGTRYQGDEDDLSGFIDKPINNIDPRYEGHNMVTDQDDEGSRLISNIITIIVILIGVFQIIKGVVSIFIQQYPSYMYFFIGLQIIIGLGLIFRIETARKLIVIVNYIFIAIFIFLLLLLVVQAAIFTTFPISKFAIMTITKIVSTFAIYIAVLVVCLLIQNGIISLKSVKKVFR